LPDTVEYRVRFEAFVAVIALIEILPIFKFNKNTKIRFQTENLRSMLLCYSHSLRSITLTFLHLLAMLTAKFKLQQQNCSEFLNGNNRTTQRMPII
jgi:hypothetical protein